MRELYSKRRNRRLRWTEVKPVLAQARTQRLSKNHFSDDGMMEFCLPHADHVLLAHSSVKIQVVIGVNI